jgi:hypothetical protein
MLGADGNCGNVDIIATWCTTYPLLPPPSTYPVDSSTASGREAVVPRVKRRRGGVQKAHVGDRVFILPNTRSRLRPGSGTVVTVTMRQHENVRSCRYVYHVLRDNEPGTVVKAQSSWFRVLDTGGRQGEPGGDEEDEEEAPASYSSDLGHASAADDQQPEAVEEGEDEGGDAAWSGAASQHGRWEEAAAEVDAAGYDGPPLDLGEAEEAAFRQLSSMASGGGHGHGLAAHSGPDSSPARWFGARRTRVVGANSTADDTQSAGDSFAVAHGRYSPATAARRTGSAGAAGGSRGVTPYPRYWHPLDSGATASSPGARAGAGGRPTILTHGRGEGHAVGGSALASSAGRTGKSE